MSGMKSLGNVSSGTEKRGEFNPALSTINFAVPTVSSITSFNEESFPKTFSPGIINSCIKTIDTNKYYVTGGDGKKIAPGLTESC